MNNILPYDGNATYYEDFLNEKESENYYKIFLDKISWKNDEALIFGKRIITKRKVAWYADKPFNYTYSKVTKKALPWTKDLLALKEKIEKRFNSKFNSCLLNLYHSGEEGMAWHSDDEKELKENGKIASVSLGVKRKFLFKHKYSKEKVSIDLAPGSILIMKGETQKYWNHRLPPTKKVLCSRINLTFRIMNDN